MASTSWPARFVKSSIESAASDEELFRLAERLGEAARRHGEYLATAESCTGGWIAQAITAVPGSSGWFERGWVTYTNRAKQEMLGVRQATLERHGAVSEAVVTEMVRGALVSSPVGTVCFAWGHEGEAPITRKVRFEGDREAVRRQAVRFALLGLLELYGIID